MLMLSRRLLMPLSIAVAVAAATTVPAATAVPVADTDPVSFPAAAPAVPEADMSHHGHVSLWSDRLEIRLRTANLGPTDVPASTVRLRFSEPLSVRQQLPPGCLWGGEAAVLCETGALTTGGQARRTALDLRLASRPAEVVVRVDTVWSGGVRDADSGNDAHLVLAPSTGDRYAF
ncbi:hypothetical protein [Streptomyces sp. SM11]|uniref:hypothetical protein n=1 Tax=Streptomyces sp. SM11 TaxID=565557 RepID=UPI0021564B66|nr:hypothetical protein [Streptomyces sp. SM11]